MSRFEQVEEKKVVSRKLSPFAHDANEENDPFAAKLLADAMSPLRKIRKNRGLTLKKLASISGISASYLSRIEVSARRMNQETLRRLCITLGCEPGDLLSNLISDKQKEKAQPTASRFEIDLPLYNYTTQGDKKILNINSSNKEWLFRPAELMTEGTAFAVILESDCEPKYKKGDMLYVKPSKTAVTGNSVIAIKLDYEVIIGVLKAHNGRDLSIESFDGKKTFNLKTDDLSRLNPVFMCVEKL